MSVEAIDRELAWVKERAGAPVDPDLGCSLVSHERLGYCGAGCVRSRRDGGPNGQQMEVLGWRLLALRDAERRTVTDEERAELDRIGLAAYLGGTERRPEDDVRWLLWLVREVTA